MPRRLSYTERARDDLVQVRLWLTQPGSGQAARRRLSAIQGAISRLKQNPCRWPTGDHQGVRELPCPGGYRALYRVMPDTGRDSDSGDVVILRIYGPGQDRRGSD